MIKPTLGAAGLAAALAACSASQPPAPPPPTSPITGDWVERPRPDGEPATVRYLSVEGGCWVLETAGGQFQPMNLPEKFRIDGQQVIVQMRESTLEMASVCQVGPLVQIDSIRIR